MAQALYEEWQRHKDETEVPPYSPEMLAGCSSVGNREFFEWYFKQQVDSIKAEDLRFLFRDGRVEEIEIIEEIPCNISPLEFERLACTTSIQTFMGHSYIYWLEIKGLIPLLEVNVVVSIVMSFIPHVEESEALRDFLYCLTLMEKHKRQECVHLLLANGNSELARIMSEVGLIDPIIIIRAEQSIRDTLQVYRPPVPEDIRLAFDLIKATRTESDYKSLIDYVSSIDDIDEYNCVFLSYLLNANIKDICCPETLPTESLIIYFLHSSIFSCDPEDTQGITSIIYMIIYYGSNKLVEELAELFDKPSTGDEETLPSPTIYITALRRSLQSLAYAAQTIGNNRTIVERYEFILGRLGKNIDLQQENHLEILKYHGSGGIGAILLQAINQELFKCQGIADLMILGDQVLALLTKISGPLSRIDVWNLLNANLGLVGEATLSSLLMNNYVFSVFNPLGMKMLTPIMREYIANNKRRFVTEVVRKFCFHYHTSLQDLLRIIVPHVSLVDNRLILGSRTYTGTNGALLEYIEQYPVILCDACGRQVGDRPRIRAGNSHGKFYCPQCGLRDVVVSCDVCLSNDEELKMQVLVCKHTVCIDCLPKIQVCAMCRADINLSLKKAVTQQEAIDHFMINYS